MKESKEDSKDMKREGKRERDELYKCKLTAKVVKDNFELKRSV